MMGGTARILAIGEFLFFANFQPWKNHDGRYRACWRKDRHCLSQAFSHGKTMMGGTARGIGLVQQVQQNPFSHGKTMMGGTARSTGCRTRTRTPLSAMEKP